MILDTVTKSSFRAKASTEPEEILTLSAFDKEM